MKKNNQPTMALTISALGIVYGDIGTSPLYALQVTLGSLPRTPSLILGILSLIFWSLVLVISIKYLSLVFRADNEGEGGILALLALLKQKNTAHGPIFYLMAIFGAGLLLGDGMLTPAISVTSALEGLSTVAPSLAHYAFPLALVVLFLVFFLQSRGTGTIGAVFGPFILCWFVLIGVLGLVQILDNLVVLQALNPYYAVYFLYNGGLSAFLLLGGVFLVMTGGEALYADIGHFGKNPIRYSWFFIVFPSLVLSYFGQGAFLLKNPNLMGNPFFLQAPNWMALPLLCIATGATIIASQAVISATFSLTKQAVLLGIFPKLKIIPTSTKHAGQIYVPQINYLLFLGTYFLLFTFRTSENMAHAYGIAVNLDMLLITIMVGYAAHTIWRWSLTNTLLVFSLFFLIDLSFLGANLHKFLTGGWLPILFAFCMGSIMYIWSSSLLYLKKHYYLQQPMLAKIMRQLKYKAFNRLKGVTSVFITDIYDESGGGFSQFIKLSLSVPENILIVSYKVDNRPRIAVEDRLEVVMATDNICRLVLHYGFMDTISIPRALAEAHKKNRLPFPLALDKLNYIVDYLNVIPPVKRTNVLLMVRQKLFSFLLRNYSADLDMEFYGLPFDRTLVVGNYCEL